MGRCIELRKRFIEITLVGPLTLSDAFDLRAEIELAATTNGIARVLFDNLCSDTPLAQVREEMHNWMTEPGRFERIAMVLHSEALNIGLNMEALAKDLRLKAFNNLEQATTWIST